LQFDIEQFKKPHLVVTDNKLKQLEKQKVIRKSVGKEIRKVERMFPISLGENVYQKRASRNGSMVNIFPNHKPK
jgi:hypothetical protein